MDNGDYLDVALRLVNADLPDVPALQAALHDEPWWACRATEEDLTVLRSVASDARAVLDAAVSGDADQVLAGVNALLAAHPPRPRLSGHSGAWHIHVADADAPPATEVAAASAWGLAQAVVRHGLDRWGQCAAEDCGNYYLDSSTNRAKRFCSPRCANRVHVAAFRSRNRD
ncbi:CGNR zinc finger domain-containing protein [Actinokineospora iranica]|uniref:CGNR zinc finger domain-containing protein n=1 Tax=Actinokineospora iranica TaxID=1271860 RepID=A0A1G6KKE0_9PSEU|nr:CGNR zinc finger domain-containing protein [Actinokineospora iranica]SDC31549.1 CGNR zinc finger domain-containing protein [Actinokineospora iranica]